MNIKVVKKLLTPNKKTSERVSEIGLPSNVSHIYHVTKNEDTGMIEGFPDSWIKQLVVIR